MLYDFELDGHPGLIVPSSPRGRWRTSLRGLPALVFVLGGFLCFGIIVIPWPSRCDWEAARRAQCLNNLKQIGLALEGYHQRHGALPPAYVTDASGRRLHSWRVLILPFLEDQAALHERYDFHEPWDGPHNIRLLDDMPYVFRCPSGFPNHPKGMTSIVAVTGPGTMFPGDASITFSDVTDGLSDTLMVAETVSQEIPWTAPRDLDVRMMSFRINEPYRLGLSSRHRGGAGIVTGDAYVHFLKDTTEPGELRSLITIAGDDPGRAGLDY